MLKNKIHLLALCCLGLSLSSGRAQEAGTIVSVEGDRVNLRAAPSLKSEVVGQADFGMELVVKDGSDTNWVELVPPADISFWVSSDYVKDGVVTTKKLNIRAGSSINYSIVGQLARHDKVQVRGTFGDWLEIAPPASSSLWASREYLFIPAPPPVEEPMEPAPLRTVEKTNAVAKVVPPVAVRPTPVPRPVIPAEPPPQDVELVPLSGQGRIVRREGTLRSYLFKGSSPSKYYLSEVIDGTSQLVAYVENKDGQLRAYRGKKVIIQGQEYWVQGEDRPVLVPRAIIVK